MATQAIQPARDREQARTDLGAQETDQRVQAWPMKTAAVGEARVPMRLDEADVLASGCDQPVAAFRYALGECPVQRLKARLKLLVSEKPSR